MEDEVSEVSGSTLESLGWARAGLGVADASVARVISAHRGEWDLVSERGPLRAIHGFARQAPAVGDWVRFSEAAAGQVAIREVLPRRGILRRKAAGRADREQIVAVHVDIACLLLPSTAEPNPRLIERYLALSHDGGVTPVVVLSKSDLVDAASLSRRLAAIKPLEVERCALSAQSGLGLDALERYFAEQRTVALIGPSGSGKSTLLNALIGEARQFTQEVLDSGKGRHTTTRRELFRRPGGGMVIDTPGMRELGLLDAEQGITDAFPEIAALLGTCKFSNCQHDNQPGCALRSAVERGEIEPSRLQSFLSLQAEGTEAGSTRPPRSRRR